MKTWLEYTGNLLKLGESVGGVLSLMELLAWVVNFFASEFGNNAIIRGGMALRLNLLLSKSFQT